MILGKNFYYFLTESFCFGLHGNIQWIHNFAALRLYIMRLTTLILLNFSFANNYKTKFVLQTDLHTFLGSFCVRKLIYCRKVAIKATQLHKKANFSMNKQLLAEFVIFSDILLRKWILPRTNFVLPAYRVRNRIN